MGLIKRKLGRRLPATQNRQKAAKTISTELSDDVIDALRIVRLMSITSMVSQKRPDGSAHMELRGADADGGAFITDRVGLPAKKCYTRPEHIEAITKLYATIPSEFHPKKWAKYFKLKEDA